MHPNDCKARFSLAYINAVASCAGFDVVEPTVDIDSVDGMFIAHAGRRPRLEFQAKATARDVIGDETLNFALPLKNYDDLRRDVMILRHGGYWHSLAGDPERENSTSVTVHIPRRQQFNPHALRTLMNRIDEKGTL